MADDFKALLEEQRKTTRLLMSVEERAEEDARVEEAARKRSEAAEEGWKKRRTQEEGEQSGWLKSIGENLIAGYQEAKASGSEEKEKKNKEGLFRNKFLGWMKDSKKSLSTMAKNAFSAVKAKLPSLSTLLMTGGLAALLYFLRSPYFSKIKDFVITELVPVLADLYDNYIVPAGIWLKDKLLNFFSDLWDFMKDPSWDKAVEAIADNKIVMAALVIWVVGWGKMWKLIKVTMKAVKVAVLLFNTNYRNNVLKQVNAHAKAVGAKAWAFMAKIGKGIAALKLFFTATLIPTITGMAVGFKAMMAPLFPVIAIVAGIALVLYSLWQGVKDAMKEFEATGSYWESTKTLLMSFISNFIGFPVNMIKSLLSWVIGKIGEIFGIESFKNVSKIMDDFDMVEFMKEGLTWIGDWFAGMFGAIKKLAQKILKKIPGGDWLSDKLFGTEAEQAEAKKAKAEEQKRFEEGRKRIKEEEKLEKQKREEQKLKKSIMDQKQLQPKLSDYAGAFGMPARVTVDPAEMERRRLAVEAQKRKIDKAETAAHVIDAKRQTYAPKTTNLTVQNTPLKNGSSANDIANYWHLTSDIRLKEDIELLGKSPSGINIYSFKYIGEEEKYQGVMAQEVLWASAPDEKGYYSVDYSKLDVDFKKLN